MFETQGATRNRAQDLLKKGSALITSSDHWTVLVVIVFETQGRSQNPSLSTDGSSSSCHPLHQRTAPRRRLLFGLGPARVFRMHAGGSFRDLDSNLRGAVRPMRGGSDLTAGGANTPQDRALRCGPDRSAGTDAKFAQRAPATLPQPRRRYGAMAAAAYRAETCWDVVPCCCHKSKLAFAGTR